jgi:hypothetical protein
MDVQLSRTLIGAYVGAADLGDAIATAQRVAGSPGWGKRSGLFPDRVAQRTHA